MIDNRDMDTDFLLLVQFFKPFPVPVVLLDLESTGGNIQTDRITEIAFLHFWQGKITAMQQLINPQIPIHDFVQKLTGIDNDMVAHAPTFAQFAPNILPLLRGSIIVAHNSKFDYSLLRHEFERMGIAFAVPTLCTVQLSRKLYPQFHRHNLDSIIERHGLDMPSQMRHRAMGDVQVLAQFLQLAVQEHGNLACQKAIESLFNPPMLPDSLPKHLVNSAFALPDSYGVSVWYDDNDHVVAVHTHERSFREVVLLLRKNHYAPATRFTHIPTLGALHSQWVRADLLWHNHLPINHEIVRHTIVIQEQDGCLKARVRPLKAGFYSHAPHGLFLHPKAAKRALQEWAKAHRICPTLLGILPEILPKNTPCPVSLVTQCSIACQNQDILAHNQAVLRALPALPVSDWGEKPRVIITESNPITQQKQELLCDSGALYLSENIWFIDQNILSIMKNKFKNTHQKRKIEGIS